MTDTRGETTALEDPDCARAFLRQHAIFAADESIDVEVLSGGVSSLVVRARGRTRCVVVKQALPRLKVSDEWLSRVERSSIEARCARVLSTVVPGSVPETLASDETRHALIMACAPEASANWKVQLMSGVVNIDTSADAGRLLGRIHARTAGSPHLAAVFDDRSFFEELRIDPYLRTLMLRHPDLARSIGAIIEEQLATRECLVHGDYSPKNLLVAPDGTLILLDHEVAHWGNPSFDIAFVLNHLCLKALKFPARTDTYLTAARAIWSAYLVEAPAFGQDLPAQTARLLGGLMLARVDGKSPVEYLETEIEKERVRLVARGLILDRVSEVDDVFQRVERGMGRA
jgi:5-methylthioribose kinase